MTQKEAQTMTAVQAKTFDHTSAENAQIVEMFRPCECEAYQDIFTYNRWKAQGYQVRKGEKGTAIVGYKTVDKEDKKTGETKKVTFARTNHVFCRCQVDKIEGVA